ncbi:MAG: enoyl-ACP reductase, partial [Verrucomicrobiia bacterium]
MSSLRMVARERADRATPKAGKRRGTTASGTRAQAEACGYNGAIPRNNAGHRAPPEAGKPTTGRESLRLDGRRGFIEYRGDMEANVKLLAGKMGIVFGVANQRSIAWAIAKAWHAAGARLAFTYQGERLKENVEELVSEFGSDTPMYPCDVSRDEDIARVFEQVGKDFGKLHVLLHSVAFAPKEALEGEFINTTREAYRVAHDVSAYSLV